jgi:hypothetical protein
MNPTRQELLTVGQFVKATDPDTVSRLRADGERTGAVAIGAYLLATDPDMFCDTLEYLNEKEA